MLWYCQAWDSQRWENGFIPSSRMLLIERPRGGDMAMLENAVDRANTNPSGLDATPLIMTGKVC
ncbi:unnamed protein product [Scytosiphon promiscuus]